MSVEFLPLSGPASTRIGGVSIPGTVEVSESGGMQAPEKKVENGYTWTTRVGAEPLRLTVTAWTNDAAYQRLANLRALRQPFTFATGTASLSAAVLDNLSPTVTGSAPGAYNTTIEIRQVQQGDLGSDSIGGLTASGPQYSRGDGSPQTVQTAPPVLSTDGI